MNMEVLTKIKMICENGEALFYLGATEESYKLQNVVTKVKPKVTTISFNYRVIEDEAFDCFKDETEELLRSFKTVTCEIDNMTCKTRMLQVERGLMGDLLLSLCLGA